MDEGLAASFELMGRSSGYFGRRQRGEATQKVEGGKEKVDFSRINLTAKRRGQVSYGLGD